MAGSKKSKTSRNKSAAPKPYSYTDLTGASCKSKRCSGRYIETSIFDDIDGVLHCSVCGRRVERYVIKK